MYHEVPKDYVGENLRPEIFLKVLQGEETGVGTGKTLRRREISSHFITI